MPEEETKEKEENAPAARAQARKPDLFADLPDCLILEGHEPNPYPPGADRSKISVLGFDVFRGAGIILGAFDPVGEAVTARHSISVMSAKKLTLNESAPKEVREDAARRLTELLRFLAKE